MGKKIRQQLLMTDLVIPLPWEVHTPSRYGGNIITRHAERGYADMRVAELERDGRVAEIIPTNGDAHATT